MSQFFFNKKNIAIAFSLEQIPGDSWLLSSSFSVFILREVDLGSRGRRRRWLVLPWNDTRVIPFLSFSPSAAEDNDASEAGPLRCRSSQSSSVLNRSSDNDDRSCFACRLHDVPQQTCSFLFFLLQAYVGIKA